MSDADAEPHRRGAAATPPLLEVRDLVTRFPTRAGTVEAVGGISWTLREGQAMALVGESGSGKSVSALSLMGLVPHPGVVTGQVLLRGRDILRSTPREWRALRGREIALVFQDPMTSLNPVLTIGRQMAEPMRVHLAMGRKEARDESRRLLERVGIPDAERRLSDHPHQFSGGQRQRIMIAMALACRPSVLIADEPTTALDVTIQAQIVALVKDLQEELGMGILWITHDLALVAGLVDRVAVMYAGTLVETAPVRELYARPRHPYTRGLLASLPQNSAAARVGSRAESTAERLQAIEGRPPDLRHLPAGCPFAPRCGWAVERCIAERPPLLEVDPTHGSACWRWDELGNAP